MLKIIKIGAFEQMYVEVCEEDPLLESEIQQQIRWFKKNPNDTRLDNHVLTKKWKVNGHFLLRMTLELFKSKHAHKLKFREKID